MRRLIAVLVTMVSCVTGGIATDSGKPEPASTLPLSTLLPQNSARCIFASVTFISDTTIAVSACSEFQPQTCSLSLLHWAKGMLQPVARTRNFDQMFENLHRAPGDAVFAMTVPGQATMYSADLSSSRKVHSVSAISFSGNTSAQWVRGGWNLYRNNGAEPTRTGIGNLRSISDQFVAIQNADGLHIETVDGKSVSVLKMPREFEVRDSGADPGGGPASSQQLLPSPDLRLPRKDYFAAAATERLDYSLLRLPVGEREPAPVELLEPQGLLSTQRRRNCNGSYDPRDGSR